MLPPTDAQAHIDDAYYKVGVHNLVFRLTKDNGWVRSAKTLKEIRQWMGKRILAYYGIAQTGKRDWRRDYYAD